MGGGPSLKVLVTGASGLLGSTLVPHLQKMGFVVLRHSRRKMEGVETFGDLTDSTLVCKLLAAVSPDVVINLAALTNVDLCEQMPSLTYLMNVKVVENLVSAIQLNDPSCHLIQISTDQVYDGVGPQNEDEVLLSNYYSFSKFSSELVSARVFSTILRTNFFGPSQCRARVSISDWLVKSLRKGEPILAFDDVYFSPLSIQTLVSMISLVIKMPHQGVFNLGSKAGFSKADFAFRLADGLNFPSDKIERGMSENRGLSAYRPKDMRMDSSKFERVFGVRLPSLADEIASLRGVYSATAE